MTKVEMEELSRVQTVGANGIGVYPPIPVERVDRRSASGIEMYEVQRGANVLPHPGAVNDGAVLLEKNDVWYGGIDAATVEEPTSTTLSLQPCPVTYVFGEVEELELTIPDNSQYHLRFTSPSGAPTSLTMTGVTGTVGDAIEAAKTYEVDIWAGVAIVQELELNSDDADDDDDTPPEDDG